MGKTLASLAALFLSAAFLIAGNGLFQTLAGVHLIGSGVPVDSAALVLAGYYVGLVLGSLRGPPVIARVGHIRSFAAFGAVLVLSAVLHPLIPAGPFWFLLRLLTGFAMAGCLVTVESWINDRAPPERRGTILSIYMIVNFSSLGFGQFLLTVADPDTFVPFSLAAALFCLAVVPVTALKVEPPAQVVGRRLSLKALYRVSPLGVVGAALVGVNNGAFLAMGPIFARGIGLEVGEVSLFMGAAIFGGLLMQWPIGRLSDRLDRRQVLAGVAVLSAVTAAVLAVLSRAEHLVLFLSAGIYGGFILTLYPLCVAHAHDFAAPDQRTGTSGGMLLAFGVGASTGPVLASLVMDRVGPAGLFMFTGLIVVLLATFTLFRMRMRASPAQEQRTPFVVVAPTSPLAGELERASDAGRN
jgi:MFS family permease